MDCHKSEASRAKELAERMLLDRDYASAMKVALKAQKLYPELEGLSQLLTIIDIYVCGENKTIGDADWYGILGLLPYCEYATMRKQYTKLALMLHPDRSKSPGAEGAFKLVSKAWNLLSDKNEREAYQRLAYRHKRNREESWQGAPSYYGALSKQPGANASSNATNSVTSCSTAQHVPIHTYGTPTTFWTICYLCSTYFQYLRIYLNQTLMCHTCQKGFRAVEIAQPPGVSESSDSSSCHGHHTTRRQGAASSNRFSSGRNNAVAQNVGDKGSLASETVKAAVNDVAQQANEKVKRGREDRQSIAEWERNQKLMGCSSFKKKKIEESHLNGCKGYMANNIAIGNDEADLGGGSESSTENGGTERTYGFSGMDDMPNSKRELSYCEMINMLMKKAQTDISKILKEQSSATESKKDKKQKSVGYTNTKENSDNGDHAMSSMLTDVPDPDFHDFDSDRTEWSFFNEQVWAAYDGDGLPRYYARIQKVISRKPFKLCISWLNSRSNSEFSSLDWIGSGFAKTCGDFRPGKRETYTSLNSFSKKISWKKIAHGMVRVFPGKMEVWALYRNWSADWNRNTPDEVVNQYEMVQVLDEFTEEHGVYVIPLLKVAGFRTVFKKHMDPKAVRRIPKEEMFRFSHIVPSHLLTGEEAHNAPKGCFELDPAAIPLHLLEVIIEDTQAPVAENVDKPKEASQSTSTRKVYAGMEGWR